MSPLPAAHDPTSDTGTLLVITTVDNEAVAESIARELVEQRLAACVHILNTGRSVYRWQTEVEEAQEKTLLIKTAAARYAALEAWLSDRHPYETPEIIALPVVQGLSDYIDWIRQCTQ